MKIGKPVFIKANTRTLLIEEHEFREAGDVIEHHINGALRATVERVNFADYVRATDCKHDAQIDLGPTKGQLKKAQHSR